MGHIISGLIGREALINKVLVGCNFYIVSLNNLSHYHSKSQNLLKSLTFTTEEFEEIFQCTGFSIWDIDNNGIVSVFEVLAGLTLLSNTSTIDKLRCNYKIVLFSLFDFNRENLISTCDLQVLLHLSFLSVCKIFGYFKDIGTHEITELTNAFHSNVKIQLGTMVEFCMNNEQIMHFIIICERLSAQNRIKC